MSKNEEIPKENGNDITIMPKGDYTIHVLIEEVQGIEQKIVDKLPKPMIKLTCFGNPSVLLQ